MTYRLAAPSLRQRQTYTAVSHCLVGQAKVAFCQQYRPEHLDHGINYIDKRCSINLYGPMISPVAGIWTLLGSPPASVCMSNYVLAAAELLALGCFILMVSSSRSDLT